MLRRSQTFIHLSLFRPLPVSPCLIGDVSIVKIFKTQDTLARQLLDVFATSSQLVEKTSVADEESLVFFITIRSQLAFALLPSELLPTSAQTARVARVIPSFGQRLKPLEQVRGLNELVAL